MSLEDKMEKILKKIEKVKQGDKLDLSSDEDLSIGIMNLISIEEHLFYTAQKTNNSVYLGLLKEVREMRVELLKKIIKEYEGEVWCISKHLLASSMRMMEVGTKALGKGDSAEAKDMFNKAYDLYSMFWALNLNLIKPEEIKDKKMLSDMAASEQKENKIEITTDKNFMSKVKSILKKALDCCRE
ncbi:MAG: hypothetical protein NTY22_09995 [Proteobacteria bacterium]|nr:hypothetical protein [Pseudomonadota bacterium]